MAMMIIGVDRTRHRILRSRSTRTGRSWVRSESAHPRHRWTVWMEAASGSGLGAVDRHSEPQHLIYWGGVAAALPANRLRPSTHNTGIERRGCASDQFSGPP